MSDQHMLSDRDRRDIQGLVLYGTTCPLLRCHFFQVSDAVGGRRFVRNVAEAGSPLSVTTAGLRGADAPSDTLVYVGFTWHGLKALALSGVTLGSFPAEFQQGAKGRAAALGDTGDSAPETWLFDPETAHIAVLTYARHLDRLDGLSSQLVDLATCHGCRLISMLDGATPPGGVHPSGQPHGRPVPFGDSDGFSQPEILPAPDRQPGTPPAVPPGMFILGHPHTPQDGDTFTVASQPQPIPAAFSYNGTFGAFRMLEQDVEAFEDFLDRHTTSPESRERLASGMLGIDTPQLIRRGMPYGPPYDPGHKRDGQARGLLGLFLCASVKDQFEFIMRQWLAGLSTTAAPASRFVTTRGAAYLFFPSVTGLRYLSSLHEQIDTELDHQATDEAVQVIVQAMLHAVGSGPTRDAHPKHHGLVRATVDIAGDLPETLKHGVFARPGQYRAYIRYSNGRPTTPPPPDAAPDVRGMAIKLFGVEGAKEAPDETLTHDFVLASHAVFFVPDVLSYVDFLRLPSLADKVRFFPDLPKSFGSFESPLSIRYSSQTPYALGPLAVKYLVYPIDPVEQGPVTLTPEQMAARSPDCLRDAMAAHLSTRPATLAFCIQLPPDQAAEQVDDATRLWDTAPIRVGTITIPAQDFRRPANDALAETISFSPWHCLREHRPLGSVNLARRRVYREASVLRHANRSVPVAEPDGVHDLE